MSSSHSRFGLGESIYAPMRPVASYPQPYGTMGKMPRHYDAQDKYWPCPNTRVFPGVPPGEATLALQRWLKATRLLSKTTPKMLERLKAHDFSIEMLVNNLYNHTKMDPFSNTGKTWNEVRRDFAGFVGGIAEDFIEKRLGYAPGSEEYARLYVRIGEGMRVAEGILAAGNTLSWTLPEIVHIARRDNKTQITFPTHPYKYAYPYGFWYNNAVNKKNGGGAEAQEGVDFKTSFGYPENSERELVLKGYGWRTHTHGYFNALMCALWATPGALWSLSLLIADADLPDRLTVRQRRAILVEKLSTYLPGMVELDDGRTLYCLADTPAGKRSTLDLDVAPEGRDPGYIPGVKVATGWFKGMEFLVEDSLIPYTQRVVRPDLRDAAPRQGVTTDTRRATNLAALAAESAAVNAASAAAAQAKAAVDAQRRELDARRAAASGGATTTSTTSTGDTGTGDTGTGNTGTGEAPPSGGGNKGKLLLGVAAAAAGIYFMNKG